MFGLLLLEVYCIGWRIVLFVGWGAVVFMVPDTVDLNLCGRRTDGRNVCDHTSI